MLKTVLYFEFSSLSVFANRHWFSLFFICRYHSRGVRVMTTRIQLPIRLPRSTEGAFRALLYRTHTHSNCDILYLTNLVCFNVLFFSEDCVIYELGRFLYYLHILRIKGNFNFFIVQYNLSDHHCIIKFLSVKWFLISYST